jgi:hypothetical protein
MTLLEHWYVIAALMLCSFLAGGIATVAGIVLAGRYLRAHGADAQIESPELEHEDGGPC